MRVSRRSFLVGVPVVALQACCATQIPDPTCATGPVGQCPAPDPLPRVGLAAERCELFAFDEVHRATPTVYRPGSVTDLQELFKALPTNRRVTIRGGGQAMDSQSLNDDLVFIPDSRGFAWIGDPVATPDGYQIEVGSGAVWENVVRRVAKLGLMPPSLVTAQYSTVGGTLSSDCLSRMSCVHGKEGEQVRKFTIVLPNGDVRVCSKHADSPLDQALFQAVVGGFGYLGVVTQITFDLVVARSNPMDPRDGRFPCVLTRSTRTGSSLDWDAFLRALESKASDARRSYLAHPEVHRGVHRPGLPPPIAKAPEWSALSAAAFLAGNGLIGNLLEQRYVDPQPLNPTPGGLYQAAASFPPTGESGNATLPTLIELGEAFCPAGQFVDDLIGWSFFLGNSTTLAKAKAHKQGNRLNITQQSFALPAGTASAVDTRPTRRFIELSLARMHAADLKPITFDFLYIPADTFTMSASRGLYSFVVTISFTELNREKTFSNGLVDTLHSLSADCRQLGGRVHLVKGVFADPGDLRAMYGDAARELLALKQKVDPHDVLRNEFFERVLLA